MLPDIWGPAAWKFLHSVTLDYPINPTDRDKNAYYYFFYSIQYVLPCAKCRNSMTKHLEKYPLTLDVLSTRDTLVRWVIDLHNIVNYYNGKRLLSYDQALDEIESYSASDSNSKSMYLYGLIFVLVIVIIILILLLVKSR